MGPIESTANPRIARIRRLAMRKERERTGLAFAEGVRAVGEALLTETEVETLVIVPELLRGAFAQGLVERARSRGCEVIEVSERVLRSLSQRQQPRAIGAVVRQRWRRLDSMTLAGGDCWLALDAIADPGNLGTLLRTCDAGGVAGVILLEHTADPYDPRAIRASLGAVFSRQLVRAGWDALLAWAEREDAVLVGTSPDARTGYRQADYGDRTVIVLGSERTGLSPEQQSACHFTVRIPMLGRADSLNIAVAGALVLYEAAHQRRGTRDQAG